MTLSGHSSHTRNNEVTNCAREGGVHIVRLPLTALVSLPLTALIYTATCRCFLHVASEDALRSEDGNLAEYPSQQPSG